MSNVNLLEPFVDLFMDTSYFIFSKLERLIFGEQDKVFDWDLFFDSVGLKNKIEEKPILLSRSKKEDSNVYVFTLPIGLELADFEKHKKALEQQLTNSIEIKLEDTKILITELKTKLPETVDYTLLLPFDKKANRIAVGQSAKGLEHINFTEIPHTLITGATGSGKSVCTKSILTNLINTYSEKECEIILIDFKVVELALFKNCKQVTTYVNEVEDATDVIKHLLQECKRRYNLFEDLGVTNISDYNKKAKETLKMQFIFIEEFVMFSEQKEGMKNLRKLASLSRASGQYIFFSCQRADNTVVDNVFKCNVGNRIVFRCEDSKNSMIALDKEGAENLRGRGHGLLKKGSEITEIQSFYIEDDKIKEFIKPFIRVIREKIAPTNEVDATYEKYKNCTESLENTKSSNPEKVYDISFLDLD